MASITAGGKAEKLSFAKVAAAGLKPASAQPTPSRTDATKKHEVTSSPPDGAKFVSPSSNQNQPAFTPKQTKVAALAPVSAKEVVPVNTNGPLGNVQSVQLASPTIKTPRALDGMLLPTVSDETATHASSTESVKPPSLDGKSVTSGTTFALDEKESLRPDDSASVTGRDDEDVLNPPDLGLPESQIASDDEMRAFRDQLREISGMDSTRQPMHPPDFVRDGVPAQGVLYIPPPNPVVANVPVSTHDASGMEQSLQFPPDPKLLEALDSPKDRIMVLKLEQDIADFVKDAKESSLKLPQTNTFYRMLAHKLADYYMLGHGVDESTMAVRIFKTPNCRLPPPLTGIATPSTAASTPPPSGPQMKILRRGVESTGPTIANGSNVTSKTTSENGESGDDDKKGKSFTREEREARYEAARKRIMGSAKPSESPEEVIEKDLSRSSSAAGKRNNKKKQRADSDDDFEGRSAYSAYYAVPQPATGAYAASPYGFANVAHPPGDQFSSAPYANQATTANYAQYSGQPGNPWAAPPLYPQQAPQNWMQPQQPGYDMPADFQRAMSFQHSPSPVQRPGMQPGYSAHYNQHVGPPHQSWPQQNPYPANYAPHPAPGYMQSYQNRPPPVHNQMQEPQPYQYGQLPSQTFPGRPPSKLEHPLPGSYKSKHFNPQSQSFVPNHTNGTNSMPFQPAAAPFNQPNYGTGYGMPTTPQGQSASPSHMAMYGSQQAGGAAGAPTRMPSQPMTHPLPQPVFPHQPSPSVPLPPKPESTPSKSVEKNTSGPAIVSSLPTGQGQSSIAKWGTPASLPAKPPPLTGGLAMNVQNVPSSR